MKVISKAEALRIHQSLQNNSGPGHRVTVGKLDGGKYRWTGRAEHYIGKDVNDIEGVYAVFVERRHDAHGAYAALMSVHEA